MPSIEKLAILAKKNFTIKMVKTYIDKELTLIKN